LSSGSDFKRLTRLKLGGVQMSIFVKPWISEEVP
jgi:hypothetical protein